ncbi:alpha-(1,3)-fucosyltransferase C isoform X2 [Manduca sexta]|uniref:Fucosyltransferase n=2 Tax=Manduca sexta TaxID=7130 RepID=A0A921YJF3_MANSE|nr:alpha-(1,3)-fucosyltransferase C isoform X2 [Manduca sexta]KAG6440305.1 hypothetical protein O3G_MSEX001238 [Manduca sexta]
MLQSGTQDYGASEIKRPNALGIRTATNVPEYEATDMPPCISGFFKSILRQMLSVKFFFLVSSISFLLSVVWIQFTNRPEQYSVSESLVQEALENGARDFRYSDVYRKTSKLPKNLKYMLLWTREDFAPFYFFENGQRAFLRNNCSVINCYVTGDRKFFDGDLTKFDAIAFNGRNMKPWDLPNNRTMAQKYIYFNMESADNYPVCNKRFDNFFNWTATYKLDSDIPFAYLQIRNNFGEIVGPKINMNWLEDLPEIDEEYSYRLLNKSKAAAWFVSNCNSRSGRKEFVEKLQKALEVYGYTVDIYGNCGPLKCPRNKKVDCFTLLERDYYFYMSLENSFAEDYVTEKLLTALQHDVVPIVFGEANYSRFLPPGSFIDGTKYNSSDLAGIMVTLMNNPKLYWDFFRWKNVYIYHDPSETDNVCAVCAALNNKHMMSSNSTYPKFRQWWNPYFKSRC